MLPICAQCRTHPVKRRDKTYCSTACRDAAARKPLPLCAACRRQPVKLRSRRYCSRACSHAPLKAVRRFCAAHCGQRVRQKKARYCSKACAWRMRGGLEAARKGRVRAAAVRRQQYVARLRERLQGATSVAQVWKVAYARGYAACHNAWRRKVERGEVMVLKPRRVTWDAA